MKKLEVTPEWNYEFLENNPTSWLVTCRDQMHITDPQVFTETCCEITIAAILWKLGIDADHFRPHVCSFRDAEKEASTFIVSFDEDDHVLLVHEGFMYQSYYRKFPCECREITDDLRDAFDNPLENWEKITGISEKPLWVDIEYFF